MLINNSQSPLNAIHKPSLPLLSCTVNLTQHTEQMRSVLRLMESQIILHDSFFGQGKCSFSLSQKIETQPPKLPNNFKAGI